MLFEALSERAVESMAEMNKNPSFDQVPIKMRGEQKIPSIYGREAFLAQEISFEKKFLLHLSIIL